MHVYLLVFLSLGGFLRNKSIVKSLFKHIVFSVIPKSSSRGVRSSSSMRKEHLGVLGWNSCILMIHGDGVRATAGISLRASSALLSTICRWSEDKPKSESWGVRIRSSAGACVFAGVSHTWASSSFFSSPPTVSAGPVSITLSRWDLESASLLASTSENEP